MFTSEELYEDDKQYIPKLVPETRDELISKIDINPDLSTEQHSELNKIMRIEKLFVFLALGFIILISTFNLFVSSTMLVLDKTRDLKILSAMGFSPQKSAVLIRLTGLIISFLGLNLGLFFGIGLCLLQKQFGFIPLGMASTMIRDYPVSVHLGDLFLIGLWVMISSYLAMIIPSKRARTITEMSSVC
jgi:lipoprotein-releasing system permease protein